MVESASFLQILSNVLLWMCIYIIFRRALKFPYRISRGRRNLGHFCLLLFCLFPFFGGDYINYKNLYYDYKLGGYVHLEDIYKWIILNISFSYHFFRLIVWGTALLFLVKAYKRLEISYDLCIAVFTSMFFIWFSYARVSLAMAIIILGLSFIAMPSTKSPIFSILLGVVIILVSEFFHRSAIIGIIAALGSFFFVNINKKRLIVICILYPFAILLLINLLGQFMMIDLDYDTFVSSNHRDAYLNDAELGRHSRGLGELVSDFLTRTPLFLTAFMYIYLIFKNKYKLLSRSVRFVSSYAFILILLAIAFSFDLGYNTYVLYYRTLTFAMIPSAVFIASVIENSLAYTLTRVIVNMGICSVLYALVYASYCALVG